MPAKSDRAGQVPVRTLMHALEPRIMFDGAGLATGLDAGHDPDTNHAAAAALPEIAAAYPVIAQPPVNEIVFVDTNVPDYQAIVAAIGANVEVVLLDTGRDGVEQIAEALDGRSGLDAIHVVSHGEQGLLALGNGALHSGNLDNYAGALAAIGAALTADGDILLYGCDVAGGETGAGFITSLAEMTGADVAASDDLTGNAALGGDWELEVSTGHIEASLAISAEARAAYEHILAPVDQNFNSEAPRYMVNAGETIGGLTYSLVTPTAGDGAVVGLTSVSGNVSITPDGSDLAVMFNYDGVTVVGGALDARIASADGSEFRIVSMEIDTGNDIGTTPNLTISGYRNGELVASDTVNTGVSDTSGSISYTKNGVALGFGGTLTFTGSDWGYIDEIRFTGTNTIVVVDDINVEPAVLPNLAPVIGNLNGDGVSYTEGAMPVLLDAGGNATVTDADSADFNGGNVTVSIVSNRVSGEDVLSIRNQGTGAGQIGVWGSNVTYGGTTIGSFTGGTGTSDLVISLNGNATSAAVTALAQSLTYSNSNWSEPNTATRTISITVNDGDGGTSSAANVSVGVTGVNDAPTISATGGTPTYTENGSAVDLFSSVTVSTVESGQTISGLTLTVSNLANGSSEILTIDGTAIALINGTVGTTSGNGLSYSVSVFGGTATVTLSSAAGISTATAQTVVDGMTYRNASEAPTGASRVVTLTGIRDNGGTANGGVDSTALAISATVSIVAVNDAPTLLGGPYVLPNTNEDTVSSATLVSTILAGVSYNDVDGPGAGIAITATAGNGTWQYSTDGVSWNAVGLVNSGAALLLSASTQLRYVPDGMNGENVSLTFRAWDQTSGGATTNSTRHTMDTSSNGGSTSLSTGTAQVQLVVSAVNDAPVLAPVAPALPGLTDTDINNAGQTVAAIFGASIADVDSGALGGIAITGLSSGNGTWQYSLNGGTSWTGIGTVSGSSALLLRATDLVRFVPDGVNGTTGSLTYHAWDQTGATAGQQGTKVDATITGGSSSFSTASDTASITVTAVNDAPIITAPGSISVTEDLAGTLTGISFADSDAGSGNVTATFSVPSGSLSASSGSGVTVGGTASALTLTGTITDINTFIAAGGVSFTTAANATTNVTLTVSVNDGGNTGSGGSQTDTTTVTLTVTAVNDAPVNIVPGAQTTEMNSVLVFNIGNGNAISISDVDAGGGNVEVTLSAINGLITLSQITGLTFTTGNGTSDSTITFTGTVANINNALNGLTFTPTPGYNGAASIEIVTNDQGNSGTGGNQTDTDTIGIAVNPIVPKITSVNVTTPDGIYGIGDTITVTMSFDQAVTVDTTLGIPSILLETGAIDRSALYAWGSGTNTLTFTYTVQAGDLSADLDYHSTAALSLNGATIIANGLNAALTLPSPGGADSIGGQADIIIDGVAPTVTSVSVPANGTYVAGQNLDFTVNLSEAVTVDTGSGTPRLVITLDNGGAVYANYLSGSGTAALTFRLTVATGQLDTNGISVGGAIDANGGTLRDVAGNDAGLVLNSVGSTAGVLVDAVAPTATITMTDKAIGIGETGQATITFSEAVTGLTVGDITVENGTITALTGSGTSWTVFFTPNANTEDATNVITVSLANVVDAVGNQAAGTVTSDNYIVDTVRPTASITISDTDLTAGETAKVTISFSEAVSGLSAADFVVPNGTLSGFASADGGVTWTATLTPKAGTREAVNVIQFDISGIADSGGNGGTGLIASPNYAIDNVIAPPPLPVPPQSPVTPPPISPSEPVQPMVITLPVMSYGPPPPPLVTAIPAMSGFSFGSAPGNWSNPVMDFQSQVLNLSIPSAAALQPGESFTIGIIGDAGGMGDMTFELRPADGLELPDWVNFDPASGTISGQVPEGFTGVVRVQIIITDDEGRTIVRVIELSAAGPAASGDQAFVRTFSLAESAGRQGLDDLLELQMGISTEQSTALLRGLASADSGRA